jgi:hypothetical protein
MPTPPYMFRRLPNRSPLVIPSALVLLLAPLLLLVSQTPSAQAQRAIVATHALKLTPTTNTEAPGAQTAVDTGQLPVSQPLTVTLRLAPTPDQTAALDQLLAAQTTTASPKFHQWLTPQQFAASFGASDAALATLTAWAQSQGLTVASISAGKTRLTLSGTTGQLQTAFATSLHSYLVSGAVHYANVAQPTLPLSIAPLVASVAGLDDIPAASTTSVSASTTTSHTAALLGSTTDPLSSAASAIDANTASILTFTTNACSTDYSQSDIDAYRAAFRQANAQGITILATSACGSRGTGSFPASLPEVTALTLAPDTSTFTAIEPRPSWQVATGLPADGNRDEPDLTTTSVVAFSQTLTAIQQQANARQGNINATLYSLATTPDLYTQPDGAATGTWESSTGLGVVDLAVLAKVYPKTTGALTTTVSLTSSSYAITYGQPITLTSKVLAPVYGTASISGTVTFTSSTQGVLGSATVDNTGTATLNVTTPLNVGTYNVTASYAGDANYAPSTSASAVIITVSIVNATLVATIAPQSAPYGSTATVTATVTLPNSSASPTGTVSAQIQGITGALYSATLSPNPGGNSATANINIDVPAPNSAPYTVSVTCAGNQNFQCQTPATPTFTAVKGNTSVTVSVNPAAPQAGFPVTITATVNNNGNGQLIYTFSGSVSFFDNGKLLATAAVGTNQATITKTLAGNVQHNIIATYSGDGNWNGSSSAAQSVTPTLLPSTLTLTANTVNTLAGANVVFTATVFTTITNTVGPTGTVTFYDTFNNQVVQLGTASSVTPNGPNQSIAIFTTTGLLAGVHSVYAVYNGDANFSPATAATLSVNVTDYTITAIPQTLTLKAGQSGQVVLLVGLVGGFNGSVTFGCTPPSGAEATCSFSQVSLQGGGSTTMSITTTAAQAKQGTQHASRQSPWRLATGSTLAMLLCFLLPRRRRALPFLIASLLAVSLSTTLGCGIGLVNGDTPPSNGGPTTDPGTPLGSQIFTITTAGSDGINTVRHTYQYQVTIQ